jgi:hypothetical protein
MHGPLSLLPSPLKLSSLSNTIWRLILYKCHGRGRRLQAFRNRQEGCGP